MAVRDQRDLMSYPFFSLSKGRRVIPIHYASGDIRIEVEGLPAHGIATIWDADILIWAGSQLVDAADHGLNTSRFFRFTPYQLLTSIGRGTGNSQYCRLKQALQRLQSTVILTTIRQGEQWRRQQFSWINEWEELVDAGGRIHGMEFVLPDWFYRGVLDRSLVLTIDPTYFRLTGGIERWLYRLARRHAGRQPNGWAFDLRHLHNKSGSTARYSDFTLDLRRLANRQSLPGYEIIFEFVSRRELLRLLPRPATLSGGTVNNSVNSIGRSGAAGNGLSGASLPADRTQGRRLSFWNSDPSRPLNLESNRDSNFSVVATGKPGRTAPSTVAPVRRRR